jgi:hypothetical protein
MVLIFHDMMDSMDGNFDVKALQDMATRIQRGLAFFHNNSKMLPESHMRYIVYPGESDHGTGTQALVCLALVDFIRALGSDAHELGVTAQELDGWYQFLDELLAFLVTQHSSVQDRLPAYNDLEKGGKGVLSSGMWYGTNHDAMMQWWLQHVEPWSDEGYFYSDYNDLGTRSGSASPYYDGESLLAITKAAKYLGKRYVHLWPVAAGTAVALHKLHVEEALDSDEDSDDTKGVYQWLSMSLFELATVTFGEGTKQRFDLPAAIESSYPQDQFGTWLVDLAKWMVHVHHTLLKNRNTGYAYEGIVPARTWASYKAYQDGDEDLAELARKLECTIEKGMSKLMSWQVGMGAEVGYKAWDGVQGLGGVQNAEDESGLRIDVTQHQMHATILTRRLVYPPRDSEPWPWNDLVLSQ